MSKCALSQTRARQAQQSTTWLQVQPDIARAEYETHGQEGLDQLLAALDGGFEGAGTALLEEASALTKVVLARRSDVKFTGHLDPLALLHALQVQCQSRIYTTSILAMPATALSLVPTPARHHPTAAKPQ